MYSQDEINSAIAAGVMSEEAALDLRAHVVQLRERPLTDEEHFRLVSSFNDIFVAIGVVIMLFAVGAIGQAIGGGLFPYEYPRLFENFDRVAMARHDGAQVLFGAGFVSVTAWMLAEFFTRKRRMALPSIILLLAFVFGLLAALGGLGIVAFANAMASNDNQTITFSIAAVAALAAVAGAWLHWRRFGVPITIAAGAAALAIFAVSLVVALAAAVSDVEPETVLLTCALVSGLAIFAFAMRWDISDRARQTRRADVAFWLHLLAAPLIAHPVFYALGVTEGADITLGAAIGVLAVYVVMGLVALAVDRRALLVSALIYVLVALAGLFSRFGAVELNVALTALVIGSALLTLSAFWSPIRSKVVSVLPHNLQVRLPVTADLARS